MKGIVQDLVSVVVLTSLAIAGIMILLGGLATTEVSVRYALIVFGTIQATFMAWHLVRLVKGHKAGIEREVRW